MDDKYVTIARRLDGLETCDLVQDKAKWHRTCYSDATNKTNISRAKQRHIKAAASGDTRQLLKRKGRPLSSDSDYSASAEAPACKATRSTMAKFDKALCFFCQKSTSEKTHMCQSQNIGKQISAIVKESHNMT